jgi:dihydrofolate reductase
MARCSAVASISDAQVFNAPPFVRGKWAWHLHAFDQRFAQKPVGHPWIHALPRQWFIRDVA